MVHAASASLPALATLLEPSSASGSGRIRAEPLHGDAELVAPDARHTPERGYVGADQFEYEARAKRRMNQQVRLRVVVEVQLVAP